MKKIFELNEKDITEIVAAEFDVDVDDVKISYELPKLNTETSETTIPYVKMQIETECDVYDR